MRNMKFKVAELQAIITQNRSAHRVVFLEAMEGFRKTMRATLEKNLQSLSEGRRVEHYISVPRVEDHTADYDRILRMLEMCTEAEVELNEQEFGQYVMDQWNWKKAFLHSNAVYSATAAQLDAEYDD